jgi:ethanolamine utilization microcompartment shell protein EutL
MALPALEWKTFPVQDPNIESGQDVFTAEVQAMKAIGLTNVQQQSSGDVVGQSSTVLAAASFLQCGKVFTIMVVVAGNAVSDVTTTLNKLVKEIPKHLPNL